MRDAGDRRIHILRAAQRLFHHYGPQKTTIAEIAKEANIGVGTVYLEFPSKDAILEALSWEFHGRVLDAILQAWKRTEASHAIKLTSSLDARFEAFLRFADAGMHGPDIFHCVCLPIVTAHRRFQHAEQQLVAEFLEHGRRAGEFRVLDAFSAAGTLLRAYTSFSPPLLFGADPAVLRREIALMHGLVLEGFLVR